MGCTTSTTVGPAVHKAKNYRSGERLKIPQPLPLIRVDVGVVVPKDLHRRLIREGAVAELIGQHTLVKDESGKQHLLHTQTLQKVGMEDRFKLDIEDSGAEHEPELASPERRLRRPSVSSVMPTSPIPSTATPDSLEGASFEVTDNDDEVPQIPSVNMCSSRRLSLMTLGEDHDVLDERCGDLDMAIKPCLMLPTARKVDMAEAKVPVGKTISSASTNASISISGRSDRSFSPAVGLPEKTWEQF